MEELKPRIMQLESLRDYCKAMDDSETDESSRVWATDVDTLESVLSELRNRRAAPKNKALTLPSVADRDRQSMYDFLHDCFAEWINDPQVGLIGMNEGESALANAIMDALRLEAAP